MKTLKDTKERMKIKITYTKMFSNHVCEDIDWNVHMVEHKIAQPVWKISLAVS